MLNSWVESCTCTLFHFFGMCTSAPLTAARMFSVHCSSENELRATLLQPANTMSLFLSHYHHITEISRPDDQVRCTGFSVAAFPGWPNLIFPSTRSEGIPGHLDLHCIIHSSMMAFKSIPHWHSDRLPCPGAATTRAISSSAPDIDACAACVMHVGGLSCLAHLACPVLARQVHWDGLLLFLEE